MSVLIIFIMEYSNTLYHLLSLPTVFSFLLGIILVQPIPKMLIAFSVGLPAASMIDALKD